MTAYESRISDWSSDVCSSDLEDIPDEAFPIVCRTVLSGHSGVGIVIADNRDDLVPANLYVKYVKKKEEYRVHLGILDINDPFNEAQHGISQPIVIAAQRKARKQIGRAHV